MEKEPSTYILTEPSSQDLRQKGIRFLVLLLSSFMCFGSYFVYDNPSALQTQLTDKLDLSSFEFNLLYSVYSFPNIILPLFGGYLVDTLGVRLSCIIFLIVVCIGHAIFSLGVSLYVYWIALLGRTVFGIGAESLNGKIYTVAQAFVVANWFRGQELTMAYGINITIARLGSVVNDWTEPAIYNWTGDVVIGLWFGLILCLISLICGIFLIIIDRKKDKGLKVFAEASLEKQEKVKFSEILKSDIRFWILCAINFTGYMCILPFNNISSAFYQHRFEFSETEAGFIISITYIIAAILSGPLGYLIDRIGKRAIFVLVSAVTVVLVHLAFFVMPDCDKCVYCVIPLPFLGFSYCIYATVMWACVSYTMESRIQGIGFGLFTSVQNTSIAIMPLVIGVIYDSQGKYLWISFMLMCVGACSILSSIWLNIEDRKLDGVMNRP